MAIKDELFSSDIRVDMFDASGTAKGSLFYSAGMYVKKHNDLGNFEIVVKDVTDLETDRIGHNYRVDIYRNGTIDFRGIVTRIKYVNEGKSVIVSGEDIFYKAFYRKASTYKYENKNETQILCGWRDGDINRTATTTGSVLTFQSDNASDGSGKYAYIYGTKSEDPGTDKYGRPYREKVFLKGTTAVSSTSTFLELWFIELSAAAAGNITVKDAGATTLGTFTAGDTVLADADATDSSNIFGNGLLYSTGISKGSMTTAGTLTKGFDLKLRGQASHELIVELLNYDWSIDYANIEFDVEAHHGTTPATYTLVNGKDVKNFIRVSDSKNVTTVGQLKGRGDQGVEVYGVAYDETAIATYGIREQPTPLFEGATRNETTLDTLVTNWVSKAKDNDEDFSFTVVDPTLPVGPGDEVNIRDPYSNFTTTSYRIVSMQRAFNRQGNEKLNVKVISKEKVKSSSTNIMGRKLNTALEAFQGSTDSNIVQAHEDCETRAGTEYPLELKFYVPPEATEIQRVSLSYITENYRAYSGVSISATHTHGASNVTVSSENAHDHRMLEYVDDSPGSWTKREFDAQDAGDNASPVALESETGEDLYVQSTAAHNHTVSVTASGGHGHLNNYEISETAKTVTGITIEVDGVDKTSAIEAIYGTLSTTSETDLDITSYLDGLSGFHTVKIGLSTNGDKARIFGSVWYKFYNDKS